MKLTHEAVIERLVMVYGDEYDLSKVDYVNKNTNITIVCRKHGEFHGRLRTLVSRKQKCKQCKIEKKLEEYNYFLKTNLPHIKLVDGQTYVNSKTKMKFTCSFHGHFENTWNVITAKNKGNCQKCGEEDNKNKRTKSFKDVLRDIRSAHGNKITIVNPEDYVNSHSRLKFKCDMGHPLWKTRVFGVVQGQGCPKCAGKNITTEEFKNKLKEIHGNSVKLVDGEIYKSRKSKHKFKCDNPDHPVFMSSPSNVIFQKSGCPECKKLKIRAALSFTTEEIYQKIKEKHGSKFTPLPNQSYLNQDSRWEFTCGNPEHPNWTTSVGSTLNSEYKYGCRLCFGESPVNTIEDVKNELKLKFGKKINFLSIENNKRITKKSYVKVFCHKHNVEHSEKLTNILKSHGCPKCSDEEYKKNRRTDTETLINQVYNVHRELVSIINPEDYINTETKLKFQCIKKRHGVFEATPHSIIGGSGCPVCKMSKGERKILFWLRDHSIEHVSQHRVIKHKGKGHFVYDFFLPKCNTVIEYDGRQHFISVEAWGGERALQNIQKIDKLKDEYAKLKCWNIIRIPYTDFDNLEDSLKPILSN